MRRSNWTIFRGALRVAVLVALSGPTKPLLADTTLNSGTTTVSTGTNFGQGLFVARTGTATMNVVAGGYATNSYAYLGFNAGSDGTATVSSGTWANSETLTVGYDGTGTLNVTGGYVSNTAFGYLGYNADSIGAATVSSGTWAISGGLIVGFRGGTGTLTVNGGSVTNSYGYLGYEAGSVGTATVSSGTWTNSGDLYVGNYGTGTLTISGGLVSVAGTLLKGTYGTINLNAGGTLQIGVGGAGGVLGVDAFTNNGILIFNRSDDSTYAGVISGNGTVTKQGSGTLTLSGSSSYTGGTTIREGVLALGSANAVGTSGTISFGGGTLQYSASNTTDYSSRFSTAASQAYEIDTNSQNVTLASPLSSSGGTLTKSGAGTLTLSGNNSYTGGTTISGGVLALGSLNAVGTSGTISFGGGTLQYSASNTTDYSSRFSTAASQAYKIDTNGQSVTLASPLTSSGGALTKSGAGTLTLSRNNSYTGGTTIVAGTVTIPSGGSISHDSGGLIIGQVSGESGTLNVTGGIVTNGASIIGNNLFSIGTVTVSSGTWATNYDLVVGYGVSSTGTLNVSGGIVTNGGQGIIGNDGSNGTVTVSSGTWVNSGDLKVGVNDGTGTLTMNGGLVSVAGTLSKGTYGTINLNSGGTIEIGVGSTDGVLLGGTGSLVNNGTLVFNRSNDSTYSGVISGAGALKKQGAGTLTLDGNNSFTGGTTISDGVLQVGAGRTTGSIVGNVVNNATLAFNRSDASTFSMSAISGTGSIQNAGEGTTTLTGQNSFTIDLGATAGRLIVGSASSVNGFSTTGNLTAASGATLELKSRGLAYVNGLSTLTSGTILAANGISFGAGANVVGTGVVSGAVSSVRGSRIEADGGKLVVGNSNSYIGVDSDGLLYTNANEVELLDRNESVLGSLTQLGDGFAGGTLRAANGMLLEQGKNLTGRGTVYGNFINQGHVYGDGSITGQKIVFAAGSTVSGIGSFENVVFDGTYSPGNSPAITNLSNGEFSSASSLLIELGGIQPGTQYDRVVDSGSLALLGGTLNVALYNGFVPSYGNSFEILQYGQLSGDFGTVNYPALSGGLSWERTTSAIAMTITVVPEPSTYAISAIATAGLASLMQWRKRRTKDSEA